MNELAKHIIIGLIVTFVVLYVNRKFGDQIGRLVEKLPPYQKGGRKGDTQQHPSEAFKTEFANCKYFDLQAGKIIDLDQGTSEQSCELASLQLMLNNDKGENLVLNGRMDAATKTAFERHSNSGVTAQSLEQWEAEFSPLSSPF